MPRIGLILLLFLVGLWPFAASFVAHHPDERHYTDAALWMLRNGDYLIPHCADNSLRFEKPILTYWAIAGSYALFGISPLSSRLPFLLAGCGVLWLTYRLALRLSRQESVARLAALIMLCHPLLVLSATRSTPDVFICLFVLLSAYGFLGLLTTDEPMSGLSWAAYGGAGLAVATKGLPVLALVGFAWGFALLNPWRKVPLRRLAHWPSILLGGEIGIAWYVAVWASHGKLPLETFWSDQVTLRVTPVLGRIPGQFARSLELFVLILMPWSLLLIPVSRSSSTSEPADDSTKLGRRFVLLWTLFITVLCSFLWKLSTRYVLLVSPLLAVVLADTFCRFQSEALLQWTRITSAVAVSLLVGVLLVGGVIQLEMGPGVVDLVGVLAGTGIALGLGWLGWRGTWSVAAASLAVCLFLLCPAGLWSLRTLVVPDQGVQIAENLARLGMLDRSPIPFAGPPGVASKVRICSEYRADLRSQLHLTELARAGLPAVILPQWIVARHSHPGAVVENVSMGYQEMPPAELAVAVCTGRLADYLHAHQTWYQIVICQPSRRYLPESPGDVELSSSR